MTAPTIKVYAYFGTDDTTDVFILDDPIRGLLDDATYVLGGATVASDISNYARVGNVDRGRSRAVDEINAGVAQFTANNQARQLDPDYASGAFFGQIHPGIGLTITANDITIFDGLVDDLDFTYPISTDSTASFEASDALATLGSAEFDAWTTTASQTPGSRITSILDRPEVAFPAARAIDTGTSTLQADNVSWGSNVLNYAQLVARADAGMLFASRDGVLTFYGRNRTVTGVGAPEFRDDGTGIPYSTVDVDYGTELLFNRVSVDATGFTKQTVQNDTSAELFGGGGGRKKFYSLSITEIPLETQAQALDLANYLLNLYAFPLQRFASVSVQLHGLGIDDQNTCLALDIGDVVRVVYTPNLVGDPIDRYCMIEGVSHQFAPTEHLLTLKLSNLADGFSGQPFILDDAEYGLLDGVSVLAF